MDTYQAILKTIHHFKNRYLSKRIFFFLHTILVFVVPILFRWRRLGWIRYDYLVVAEALVIDAFSPINVQVLDTALGARKFFTENLAAAAAAASIAI